MFLFDSVCEVEKGIRRVPSGFISVDSSIKISYPNTVQILNARLSFFILLHCIHHHHSSRFYLAE